MSHVNAEKTIAGQIKSVAGAGAAKMMAAPMGKMDMGSMMKGGMGPMMNEGMGSMMKGGMGPMMNEGMGSMMMGGMGPMMKTPGVATGVVVYTGSSAGKKCLQEIFSHTPWYFSVSASLWAVTSINIVSLSSRLPRKPKKKNRDFVLGNPQKINRHRFTDEILYRNENIITCAFAFLWERL